MSAPQSAEQANSKQVHPDDLVSYQPQISKLHSRKPIQNLDLVVLSQRQSSAEEIAQTLAKGKAEGQRILWYNGSKYHELQSAKFVVLNKKFQPNKPVYVYDVLYDQDRQLHDRFSKSPIVPVSSRFLNSETCKSLRISKAAPHVLVKLKDGTQHFAPMLYLDLLNFDLDWTVIDSDCSMMGDLDNSSNPTRPSFDIPAPKPGAEAKSEAKSKKSKNKKKSKNNEAIADNIETGATEASSKEDTPSSSSKEANSSSSSKEANSSSSSKEPNSSSSSREATPGSSESPSGSLTGDEMSLDKVNEIYNEAKAVEVSDSNAQGPSVLMITLGLLIALIIMGVSTYYSPLKTADSLHTLVENNEAESPIPEVVFATSNEVLEVVDKAEVQVYEEVKNVLKKLYEYFQIGASFVFLDAPKNVYYKLQEFLEHKPHNTIVSSGSASSMSQKVAESYMQGAVEVL